MIGLRSQPVTDEVRRRTGVPSLAGAWVVGRTTVGASTGWLGPPAADAPLRRLPPELRRFAETNACRG